MLHAQERAGAICVPREMMAKKLPDQLHLRVVGLVVSRAKSEHVTKENGSFYCLYAGRANLAVSARMLQFTPGFSGSLISVGLHEAIEKQSETLVWAACPNSCLLGTQLCRTTGHRAPPPWHAPPGTVTCGDPSLATGSPQLSSHGPKPIWGEIL